MSEERLIGYKPNLEYKDEYTSDATDYFNKQQNTEIDNDSSDNLIGDLIDQMEIIDSLTDKLPGNASDIVGEVVDQVIDFIKDELSDKEYSSVPDEEDWTYEEIEEEFECDLGVIFNSLHNYMLHKISRIINNRRNVF